MIYWPKIRKLNRIPAPLIVVVTGILLSEAFRGSSLSLQPGQLVSLPGITSFSGLAALFKTPDFSHITDKEVWIVAGTIAVVASLETLLNLEAADKLDPIKRVSPANRELVAQGVGNIACGMLGGLPMTSVIVRTSANVHSGAKSKLSAILHGIWLLLSFLLIPELINQIPLSCLAAILLFTGYKLARISLFRKMWAHGRDQFIPFTATIVAVVCTDLLTGVGIGMAIGIFFILRTNLRNPYFYTIASDGTITIRLAEEVSFLNKAAIQYMLAHLPSESTVAIDGTNSRYIDRDVLEIIHNFKHHAHTKAIIVMLKNLKEHYSVPALKDLIYHPKSKI
jgi:MFS superfamily sulfate permease-like transporter